ncbi:MAG: multicopper oxidase domain-containing protein [Deltaproteobacteria bacterium]|nr:multicopper oxidase domain-containing protein [Deltaproteobacteria bacterium]
MKRTLNTVLIAIALWALPSAPAHARVAGAAGPTFDVTARADEISTSDGDSMWMWGYALGAGRMQYPGPTMIVNQGDTVTITLHNQLPVPVSMIFPGLNATATGGSAGLLTQEVPAAPPGQTTGTVTYRFRATSPGTFTYFSGSRSDLEVEMGLMGAIIVRPRVAGAVAAQQAYDDASTLFDQEFLFLVSEADPDIHKQVAFHCGPSSAACDLSGIDMTKRHPTDWFVNGRNFPDTLSDAGDPMFPTQPYNCAPMFHPGDRVLIRWVAGGVDFHPYHTHGQNHVIIARDARLLKTSASASADLAVSDYTTTTVPGETVDAIWGPWTGAKLGWDVYGTQDINPHSCNAAPGSDFDPVTHEYCPDHNKEIPVSLPSQSDLTFGVGSGGEWGGTPYLGVPGDLPPVEPAQNAQLNVFGGIAFMWHSHAERELTTNNIFIGGMATMALVVPVSVAIP